MTRPQNVRLHVPARLRASAVIVIGLLLALTATIGPLPPPTGEPGASLAVRLPGGVGMVVLTLLALSTLILLALQRRPRPTEDEPTASRPRQRLPAWVAALLPLCLLVLLAVLWHRRSSGEPNPIETAFTTIANLLDLLVLARKPPTSIPFFDVTITILLVLFALTTFALMVLIALADRLEKWWAGRAVAVAGPAVPGTPAASLVDPRAEPDPRLAIIGAWGRFEHALAAVRAPRAAWQTPAEFMRAALARLPLPVRPVERLTALFELARFSHRPLGADAREAACDCLDEITAALDKDAAHAR
ncbi:MAG TPA: DUF4129 domain-containing protein [Methylomirabilota bacterium]|nr:DUF4129 domain-containing protein [Methylomirabilota bacterium]